MNISPEALRCFPTCFTRGYFRRPSCRSRSRCPAASWSAVETRAQPGMSPVLLTAVLRTTSLPPENRPEPPGFLFTNLVPHQLFG